MIDHQQQQLRDQFLMDSLPDIGTAIWHSSMLAEHMLAAVQLEPATDFKEQLEDAMIGQQAQVAIDLGATVVRRVSGLLVKAQSLQVRYGGINKNFTLHPPGAKHATKGTHIFKVPRKPQDDFARTVLSHDRY